MGWEIKQLPSAPSANALHHNVFRGGKIGFRRNSDVYIRFKHEMMVYELANRISIAPIKEWVKGKNITCQLDMYFLRGKIFCKDGRVKKFDHHNLIKAQIDALASMLGFDDSSIFRITAEKKLSLTGLNYVDCILADIDEVG